VKLFELKELSRRHVVSMNGTCPISMEEDDEEDVQHRTKLFGLCSKEGLFWIVIKLLYFIILVYVCFVTQQLNRVIFTYYE